MSFRRSTPWAAALVASCLLSTAPAQAYQGGSGGGCDGFYGGLGGFGYGAYLGVGDLYRVLGANVPYFSAFPPVYYSVPVPRTYGYSPFAYLPHVQTPEVVAPVEPMEVQNPYYQPSDAAAPDDAAAATDDSDKTTQRVAPRPQTIVNPFVVEAREAALAQRAQR